MAQETRPITEIQALLADLHQNLKLPNLKQMGLWVYRFKLDPKWVIVCAGSAKVDKYQYRSADGKTNIDGWGEIDKFHTHIYFNDWLAALMNPFGGEFVKGCACDEDRFIEALKREIAHVDPDQRQL